MKERHSIVMEDAKNKIDRSEASSFAAKRATPGSSVSAAKCPFCEVDCGTRKKLMRHLEVEHQDVDGEIEPELKIVRLENNSEEKLFSGLNKDKDSEAEIQAKKVTIVSNLLNTIGSKEGRSKVNVPGTSGTIEVSATSIKFPERRYKCFWCEASFRKRGKLMDHIDMFHKANKQQIEDEAELLHVTAATSQEINMKSTAAPQKQSSTGSQIREKKTTPAATITSAATITAAPAIAPEAIHKSTGKKKQSTKKQKKVKFIPADIIKCPKIPNNNVCVFRHLASITEISKMKRLYKPMDNPQKSCTFFNRKEDNPVKSGALELDVVEGSTSKTPKPKAIILVDDSMTDACEITKPFGEEDRLKTVTAHRYTTDSVLVTPQPPPPTYMDTVYRRNSLPAFSPRSPMQSPVLRPTFLNFTPAQPLFDAKFSTFHQQSMLFPLPTQPALYLNQQQRQQQQFFEYQQRRTLRYPLPLYTTPPPMHNPDVPLDLTTNKYLY